LTLTRKGERLNAKNAGTVEAAVERALALTSTADVRAAERALQALAKEFATDKLER
jgi:hypothetical protein